MVGSYMANETIVQLVNAINVYLSTMNRQSHSSRSACQHNVTLVWLSSANSSRPFMGGDDSDEQLQAVMYIVVVLMFYSVTIATAMIKYMHQESQQANEDQMYQDFLVKTKQLAMQQAKMEFARRVSIQLVAMSQAFNGRQSIVASVSRRSTLPVLQEMEPDMEDDTDTAIENGPGSCNMGVIGIGRVGCPNKLGLTLTPATVDTAPKPISRLTAL